MADQDKTEDATPQKKEKLHQEGNVPKSADAGTAVMLLTVAMTLTFMGATLVARVMSVAARLLRLDRYDDPIGGVHQVMTCVTLLGIPVMALSLVSFGAGFAQTRVFTLKPLAFKLDKLNPIPNFKKILPSKETLLELTKQVVKLTAVAFVAYSTVKDATPRFAVLPSAELATSAAAIATTLRELVINAGFVFIAIALADYFLAVRKFNEDAKMSKEEVKDERKQQDASPEVKAKQRRMMAEMMAGAPAAVAEATVVITNPTHFAVALRYESDKDDAPVVLAKGVDDVALEMRSVARKNRVPVMENRPLARALYAEAKVGKPIPLEFYRAVAEVIAFVLQLRGGASAPAGGNR